MSEKLLLVDIGNTCVKLVFASPDALEASYSLPTRAQHTPDSLGLALMQLLSLEGLKPEDITTCAVCSVVPDVNSLFRDACLLVGLSKGLLHDYLDSSRKKTAFSHGLGSAFASLPGSAYTPSVYRAADPARCCKNALRSCIHTHMSLNLTY